jgi:glutaconate CoA-transferase subunit A
MRIAAKRATKLVSLPEAARLVADGMRLALGGFTIYNRPMALVRELVRQRRANLTVVAMTSGPEVELLAMGDCLRRVETSYVGLEKYGLAQRVRALVESGLLELVDHSEVISFDRFRADGDNASFVAVDYLAGNSLLANPDIVAFDCPLTGRRLHAVPPALADVSVVHVPAADEFGNGLMPLDRVMPQDLDLVLAQGSSVLILTTERIVRTEDLAAAPGLVQIPAFRTAAVAFAPWGAHPGPMLGYYVADDAALTTFGEIGRDQNASREYVLRHVHDLADHEAYLNLIGLRRLVELQRRRP